MSSRCDVFIIGDTVVKKYISLSSFNEESEVYKRLSGKRYIPELIEIDNENRLIKIKKIDALTLYDYVTLHKKIPYNLAKDLKYILLDMANNGIVDTPDFYKFEHIFIDEDDAIKIIDFDVNISFPVSNPHYDSVVRNRKMSIEKEYAFLEGELESWEEFKEMLYSEGLTTDIVNDFYNNMLK